MRRTRIFLALLAALLVTVDARPDGYGVKGGRSYKAAADAVASAHATANANGGSLGIAKSSASAIANANSNSGGASSAFASADASAYGGKIDETENGNANGLNDSGDLRQSSDHGKDAEYKCINHEDVAAGWNSDAEHVASHHEDSRRKEESHGDDDCSPIGVKGHGEAPGAVGQNRCKGRQSSVPPHQTPTQDGVIDLSANSQHPTAIGGRYEENGPRPGTIGADHTGSGCGPGDSGCLTQKPGVSNPYPTYQKKPDLSAGSSGPGPIDGGYGGSGGKPAATGGSYTGSPCALGDTICLLHHPSGNPHSSTGSSSSVGTHGGIFSKPQIAGSVGTQAGIQCASGDSKCSPHMSTVPNSHSTYGEDPHMLVDAQHTVELGNEGGEQNSRPGFVGEGHDGTPCASGDWKCLSHKPTVPNSPPRYDGNPHMLVDSQHPVQLENEHEEQNSRPGSVGGSHAGTPCASGDWTCLSHKPTVSNSPPTYNGHPHMLVDSQHPVKLENEHGEQNSRPGSVVGNQPGIPCAFGDWKCSSNKPTVSNPHSTYHETAVSSSAGSQHSTTTHSEHVGENERPGTNGGSQGANPCANGDSTCSSRKPSVSQSYPIYNSNSQTSSSGSTHSTSFGDTHSGKPTGGHYSPDAAHQIPSTGQKLETLNPFLNGQIDTSIIKSANNPVELAEEKKTYSSNPFLSTGHQTKPPTDLDHPIYPSEGHSHSSGVSGISKLPEEKPKPSNPFFSHHGTSATSQGTQHTGISTVPQQNDKFPNGEGHSVNNGSPHVACDGSSSCSPNKPAGHFPKPVTDLHGTSTSDSGNSEHKLNPENPFLTQYGHRAHSAGFKYPESQNPAVNHPTGYPTPSSDKDCQGSESCTSQSRDHQSENPSPTNDGTKIESDSTATWGHSATQKPENSNPFFGRKPDSHGSIPLKPQNGPSPPNPFLGTANSNTPFNEKKPDTIQACGGGASSAGCNNHNGPIDHIHGSVTGEHGTETAASFNEHGVKGHSRPAGVKGGPRHQGYPIKMQGNSGLPESDDFGAEQKAFAQSAANASASANANAYASSSSSSGNGKSSASASSKSQAYSGHHDDDGSSNSWSSSSASASASAFASSYSSSGSHHGWLTPEIPQVPAE